MRCSNCGKELTAEDKFCSRCGKAVPPQDIFCSQCGKKLAAEDKFCSQCGTAVAPKAVPGKSGDAGVGKTEWPETSLPREVLLEMLASDQYLIANNDRLAKSAANAQVETIAARAAVRHAEREMLSLAALKKIAWGIRYTPEPVTLAEKRAYLLEALAVTDKQITPELQAKDSKKYEMIVQKKAAVCASIQKIDEGKVTSRVVFCPHCHKWTNTDFTHCVHCYKSVNPSAPRPVLQVADEVVPAARTVPTPAPAPAARTVPTPTPAPAARTVPTPTPAPAARTVPTPAHTPAAKFAPTPTPAPQASAGQVRYADESMKNWVMLPGEKSVRNRHIVGLMQPDGGKFTYSMEVTDKRILLWRESNKSSNFGYVARMGGGLLGSLVAAGAKAAVGAGPKPWLEIPLTAISSCGLRNKGEFYITADQTYVLQNLGKYEKYLPDLVANAKK